MVEQKLVEATALQRFATGAPYTQDEVDSAAEALRTEVEWHIAPVVTETVQVEPEGSTRALLPTLRVVEVTEVRDAENGRVLTGWRVNKRTGVLTHGGHWPTVIEVDLQHGYASCPAELLPILAERMQRARAGLVRQEGLASRSVTLGAYDPNSAKLLARYALPPES